MISRIVYSVFVISLIFHGAAFAVSIRDAKFETGVIGKVIFSHRDHIDKKGMAKNCRACHEGLFNLKKRKHFTMADMAMGKSCGACHNGKPVFGIDKCSRCHIVKEIVFKVKETGETRFSHKAHFGGTECGKCHPVLFAANRKNSPVGMAAMAKGKSCGACHNGKNAFSVKECSKCHPTRELLFEEKSTGNVPFSHKFHAVLYSCADCHTSIFESRLSEVKMSMQAMESGKSCGVCHDGKTAFSVKDKCESCHKSN
jgi:c(7)-type cytochrome triheme protein